MAGNPPIPPPRWNPLICRARFTLTLEILSSSPATAALGRDTEDVSSTYLTLISRIFWEMKKKIWEKRDLWIHSSFPALWVRTLPTWLLLTKFLWTYFSHWTIWADCKDSKEELCVKHQKNGKQHVQPRKGKAKRPQWQFQYLEDLWKRM